MDSIHDQWDEVDAVAMALELNDPNQPYSCSAWGNQFNSSEPLIIEGGPPYTQGSPTQYQWWGMFENQYVPANAFIDHNMKVHYKTNTLSEFIANLRIEEMLEDCGECYIDGIPQEFGREDCCEVFGGTYHGYNEGLDYDEIYCDAVWSSLCFCSGTVDSDGDGIADECDDCSNMSGDINDDMIIDILDIVSVVNIILNGGINSTNYTDCELSDANYNGDAIINVLDIIQIINQVLGNNRLITSSLVNNPVLVNSVIDNQDLIINFNSDNNVTGFQLSFYSNNPLNIRIDEISSDLLTSNDDSFDNVISNGIQNFVAFSLKNMPLSNDLKIIIEDGAYLKYEDLEIVLSNANGEQIEVLWNNSTDYNVNSFSLSNLFPNPFNPSTEINYTVLNDGNITVKIFNLVGQEIVELYNGFQSVGDYKLLWNAENIASGVYFIQMFHSDGQVEKLKAVLLK